MVIILLGVDVMGKSYYNTAENNFGGLFPHPGMRMQGRYKAINEDLLIEENATMATHKAPLKMLRFISSPCLSAFPLRPWPWP